MKNCRNKVSHTCGTTNFATCISYEGEVNLQSELAEENCYNLEEVAQDIYHQLEQIDVTDIDDCLEYPENEDGKIEIKSVVKKHGEEICNIKDSLEQLSQFNICNTPISECNFDFGDLVDECGNQPQTFGELIQLILDQLNTP